MNYPIYVNCYSISKFNSVLRLFSIPAVHSTIEFLDYEYSYGGHDDFTSGIQKQYVGLNDQPLLDRYCIGFFEKEEKDFLKIIN